MSFVPCNLIPNNNELSHNFMNYESDQILKYILYVGSYTWQTSDSISVKKYIFQNVKASNKYFMEIRMVTL